MKKIAVLILFVLLSALNTIAGFFWWQNTYYKIYKEKLSNRYRLPNGLKLDYWGYDVSKENYGVMITDTMGGLVLREQLSIGEEGSVVSKLNDYHLEGESLMASVILNNRDTVDVEINKNHSLQILADSPLTKESNRVNLNDKKLLDWLRYKNSYHINFSVFSLFFVVSIVFNLILAKSIYKWIFSVDCIAVDQFDLS